MTGPADHWIGETRGLTPYPCEWFKFREGDHIELTINHSKYSFVAKNPARVQLIWFLPTLKPFPERIPPCDSPSP